METRTRPAPATVDTADLSPTGLQILRAANGPLRIAQHRLRQATAVWMSLVFALCYLGLPWIGLKTGLLTDMLQHWTGNLVAFVWVLFGTLAWLRWARPEVEVPREGGPPTWPIVAATGSSLVVWALLQHNLFQPFPEMGAAPGAMLVGFNVIESSLFGVMLASFARTIPRALAYGAVFQLVFTVLQALWFSF